MTMLVCIIKTATGKFAETVTSIVFLPFFSFMEIFQISGSSYFSRVRLHASLRLSFSSDIANPLHVDGRFL